MKPHHTLAVRLSFVILFLAATLTAQEPAAQPAAPAAPQAPALEIIKLDTPRLDAGVPTMQALKQRRSERKLAETKLSKQQLSEVLWAADGVNREDGHRTAPSAMGKFPVDIYVVLEEGVYLYSPAKHELAPVAQGDFRKQAGTQDYVYTAPLNLVYVADYDKFADVKDATAEKKAEWACMEVGSQSENVYFYCASEGLATVFRVSIDKEQFGNVIQLRPSQSVIAAQTVGNTK
ncbi:MAG: SagB/ThcOx family dehydrogenase [Candidatus Hydrogenedentales bacterium]|jgi:SagB-type dehydrogenase family enzyme